MTSKSVILRDVTFDDFASFFRFLRSDKMRPFISIGQAEALADIVDARLPANITIEQRTPKGTTYVYIDDKYLASVNQAGTPKFPKPTYNWTRGKPLTNNL